MDILTISYGHKNVHKLSISEKAVNDLLRKCDSLANVELASKF